ncbi:unnamed protein product [Discula destructiva]
MGARSSFAWPDVVLQSPQTTQYSEDLSHYASEASLSPPCQSRSISSSPPRMTPEQRELKRQRDQARRDSKLAARLQRASSHSSHSGHYEVASPPRSTNGDYTRGNGDYTRNTGDYTSTTDLSHMPIYTTAPPDISLLTEPTTLAPQMILPSYSPPMPSSNTMPLHSPPLPSSTSTVFPSPYQPHSYLPDYPYTPSSSSSVSSQFGHISHEPSTVYSMAPMMHNGGMSHHGDGPSTVRIVQSRPKPQCWEHGCNGRQFSTFSNLLRHQREKSGQASKASCPDCGAEFTRTTARNGHLLHQKCKTKRQGSTLSE